MNIKQAIATAKNRVSMERLGNQWTVYTWSPKYNATQTTQPMDFWRARNAVWENRVSTALELLGIDRADERALRAANDADYRDAGDWRYVVRRIAEECAYDLDREEQMRGSIR